MLPLSVGRPSSLQVARKDLRDSFAWLKPANIALVHSAEVRALIAWLALAVGVAVAIGLGYVWVRLKVTDLGYRLVTTRQVIEKLNQEQRDLSAQVATLVASSRLEEVARTRLGMNQAQKGQEAVLP